MKNNTFYNFEYVPNKIVYVYSIKKGEIKFLAFPNSKKAIKHSTNSKKDFKALKTCFKPCDQLQETIKNELKK